MMLRNYKKNVSYIDMTQQMIKHINNNRRIIYQHVIHKQQTNMIFLQDIMDMKMLNIKYNNFKTNKLLNQVNNH